ncbi:hypothetical protein [Hymenobacter negativus]|uniref:Uncharacterized protein n=1 Tax=Hymenobacter negativus TaxID=2795026 RepID=A0ABS3QNV4_9BACT|nr:hypothetical protein [Hymenobacter negativus]MBO2012756.1 hypothetical protein [Hymenobacter negativus]
MKKTLFAAAFTLFLGVMLSLAPLTARAQCTMCKSQVEAARQERDDYDVAGLNKGIVYMMTVPYILMGAVGYFWYRRTHPKVKAAKA